MKLCPVLMTEHENNTNKNVKDFHLLYVGKLVKVLVSCEKVSCSQNKEVYNHCVLSACAFELPTLKVFKA